MQQKERPCITTVRYMLTRTVALVPAWPGSCSFSCAVSAGLHQRTGSVHSTAVNVASSAKAHVSFSKHGAPGRGDAVGQPSLSAYTILATRNAGLSKVWGTSAGPPGPLSRGHFSSRPSLSHRYGHEPRPCPCPMPRRHHRQRRPTPPSTDRPQLTTALPDFFSALLFYSNKDTCCPPHNRHIRCTIPVPPWLKDRATTDHRQA